MKTKIFILLFFLSSCSHVFYQPSAHQYLEPKQWKLEYQDLFFKSLDGTKLHSWFFPAAAPRAKGTVVFFHGNAQNLSTHFMSMVWIQKQGYNLFIFDYRGYGKSEGVPNQEGVNLDALAALEKGRELNTQYGNGKFIVYGQSLGGMISLRALADYKELDQVDLVVQDSTFSSYTGIAFNKLTSRWFLYPFSPLAYLLISNTFASEKIFDQIKRPLLVIVGEKDPVIPAKFGKKIYKGIHTTPKWIWKLPEGGHIDVFHGAHLPYREKFLNLLEGLKGE
jgi:fermentation-respiration switch protein FrsA (DUF1100 family)